MNENEQPFNLKEALYYAIREEHNRNTYQNHNPDFIDKKWDWAIRKAIETVEASGWPDDIPIYNVEIDSLYECAKTRGIEVKNFNKWRIKFE